MDICLSLCYLSTYSHQPAVHEDTLRIPMLRSVLEQMLEAANWAPTHGRTEPWRFVVLSPEGLQQMISITDRVRIALSLGAACSSGCMCQQPCTCNSNSRHLQRYHIVCQVWNIYAFCGRSYLVIYFWWTYWCGPSPL